MLQALWKKSADGPIRGVFGCVMAPTRELAFQIAQSVEALGSDIGVKCVVLVGGMDMVSQSIALSRNPHIIVCSPGRLVDHLENTKGFNLKSLQYLVHPPPGSG